MNHMKFKQGACLIVTYEDTPDKLVVIKRGAHYSIPGGKREPNESCLVNAVRELHEETGIKVAEKDAICIFSGICTAINEITYWVTTYWVHLKNAPKEFHPIEPDMQVSLVTMEEFENCNAFPSYNYEVIARLQQLKRKNND